MQTQQAKNFDIIASGFDFSEAPRVSPEGDVWFADLTGKGVYRKRDGHEVETMVPDRQWVGGILFDESGLALCSGRDGIVIVDPQSGRTRNLLSQIDSKPVIAVNDMEADGRGGFFAGTIDFVSIMENGSEPSPGLFFHMSAKGETTILRRDVFASNGIALSPCGEWLYHSETSRGIWRYPLSPEGLPGQGELLVEMEDSDGLVADSLGNLWVAAWSSGRLMQFTPAGVCTVALGFSFPHIVSLAFGPKDPFSLYIATGGNAETGKVGAILRMKVDVPGLPGGLTKLRTLGMHA